MAVPPSMKNAPLTLAAGDLGLGDKLQDDVQAQILQRRKKLIKASSQGTTPMGAAMSPASASLFPGVS
jgi:hypothetical protein